MIAVLLVLLGFSFYGGYSISQKTLPTAITANATAYSFIKTKRPELKIFVMSFCPYGNQMEDTLRPVFDLIGSNADFTPHYIYDKINDLPTFCKTRSRDANQSLSLIHI